MTTQVDAAVWLDADGTVSVSAAADKLVDLSLAIAGGSEAVIALRPVAADARAATAIRVRPDPDSGAGILISRQGDELVLAGDPAALAVLAKNIGNLGGEPAAFGGHIHVEYFPDHAYLRAGSLPMVVTAT